MNKAILHDHLDGGLRPSTALELAKNDSYKPLLEIENISSFFDRSSSNSLEDYLEAFIHTTALMNKYENLERIAFEAAEDMYNCGINLYESRYAPLYSVNENLSIKDVLESKSQKIFKRDVVRIITPGTIIEDSLLDSKINNNLLSIFLHKGLISIAWVDMTSGLVKLERIEGKNFLQYLTESIHKIEPGEIIVSEEIKNSKILNEKLGIFDKQISYIPHTFYDHKNNTDVINNFFDIKKIQSLADLNQTDIAVAALK